MSKRCLIYASAQSRYSLSSYRLREGREPEKELSLIMRDESGVLLAAIRFWRIEITPSGVAALLLGPIAVHPTAQGAGYGSFLINEALKRAALQNWSRIILIGDASYYNRFGFKKNHQIAFPPPTNPSRILVKELAKNAFNGIYGTAIAAPISKR